MKNIIVFILLLNVCKLIYGQNPITLSEPTKFSDYVGSSSHSICALSSEKFIIAYEEGGIWEGKLRVGIIQSDKTVVFGDVFTFSQNGIQKVEITTLSTTKFFITYRKNGSTYIKAGEIANNDEILFGGEYTFNFNYIYKFSQIAINNNTAIIAYHDYYEDLGQCKVVKIGENLNITFGTANSFSNSSLNTSGSLSIDLLSNSKFVIAYGYSIGKAVIGTINPDETLTFGDSFNFNLDDTYYIDVVGLDEDSFATVFSDNYQNKKGTIIIGTKNQYDQIVYSNKFFFNDGETGYISAYKSKPNEIIISYNYNNSDYNSNLIRAQIDSNNISFSQSIVHNDDPYDGGSSLARINNQEFVVIYPVATTVNGYVRLGNTGEVLGMTILGNRSRYLIYPNPVQNNLNIKVSKMFNKLIVRLFDLRGRLVFDKFYYSNNISISISDFQSGTYFIQLNNGNEITTKKILIE